MKDISLAALLLFFLITIVGQPTFGYLALHLSLLPDLTIGWAGIKVVLLALCFLFGIPDLFAKLERRISLAGALLLIWVMLLQAIQAPALLGTFPEETATVLGNTLLTSTGLWLVGINFASLLDFFTKSRAWKCVLWLMYAGYVATVVGGIALGFVQSGRFVGLYRNPNIRLEYLQISDAFVLLTFLVATVATKKATRFLLLLCSGLLLFATLSRASFLFYWLTLGVQFFLVPGRKHLVRPLLLAAITVAVLVGLIVYAPLSEMWEHNRIGQFFRAPLADESVQLRLAYFSEGLQRLSKHWILGSFMAEVTEGSGMGTYMHNWLSFWEAYGIGPFLLSCVLIGALVWGALRIFKRPETNRSQFLAAYVAIFCFLNVAIARSYVWPYIWLVIGALPILWPPKLRCVKGGMNVVERGL